MNEAEVPLRGNVAGAVRVGATVRRPVGRWTPAVHALLAHPVPRLRCVPRVHGLDEDGREILDYLEGTVVDISAQSLSDGQLHSLSHWTKDFHEAVVGFEHPGPWRYFPIPSPSLIGHNDLGPYNVCFDGDELVGVFDWDLAGPSNPLSDLAFLAWTSVPLADPQKPAEIAHRLELVAQTYGGPSAIEILRATPPRIQTMIDGIPQAARDGDSGMRNLVRKGVPEQIATELASLTTVMTSVARHLTRL